MDEQAPDKTPATEPATDSVADESKLGVAKQKLASLAEKAKEHDFKGDARKAAEGVKNLAENLKQRDFKEDARKAAEGVKNLKESLKKHDFKAELCDAFAETKKNPASLWKKPETLRPGKDLAIVGLAASVVLLLLILVTSSSFLGLVCLVLGLGALLLSALGLKTEGRKLAVGGSVVGLLVVLCALGQTFGSSGDGETAEEAGAVASAVAAKPAETAAVKPPKPNETASASAAKPVDKPIPPPMAANEGKASKNVNAIFAAADDANKNRSLNFYGFNTGMSAKDAKFLVKHYGLTSADMQFKFNKQSGEVYSFSFTPRALTRIMDVANNFDTIEIKMLQYFGIVSWNNQKEVIDGEIESIFQDDADRFWRGDAANVNRKYVTADGVITTLVPNPKAWTGSKYIVFYIYDSSRAKKAIAFNDPFDNNNKMREMAEELDEKGVKARLLRLPSGYELLMQEKVPGRWISSMPVTPQQLDVIFKTPETGDSGDQSFGDRLVAANREGVKQGRLRKSGIDPLIHELNNLPDECKGDLTFRLPFPEEGGKAFNPIAAEPEFFIAEEPEAAKEYASSVSDNTVQALLSHPDFLNKWNGHSSRTAELRAIGTAEPDIVLKGYGQSKEYFTEQYLARKGIIKKGNQYFKASGEEMHTILVAKEEARKKAAIAEQEKLKAQAAANAKRQREADEIANAKKERSSLAKQQQQWEAKTPEFNPNNFYMAMDTSGWHTARDYANRINEYSSKRNKARAEAQKLRTQAEQERAAGKNTADNTERTASSSEELAKKYEADIERYTKLRDELLASAEKTRIGFIRPYEAEAANLKKKREVLLAQKQATEAKIAQLRADGMEDAANEWSAFTKDIDTACSSLGNMAALYLKQAESIKAIKFK